MSIPKPTTSPSSENLDFSSLRLDQLDDVLPGGNTASETSKNIMRQLIAADYVNYSRQYPEFPKHVDYSRYDRINITAEQGQKLIELCQTLSNPTISELFKAPVLSEFTVHVDSPTAGVTTYFKPTIVPASIFSLACHDCGNPCQPYVDAYLSSDETNTEIIFAIGTDTKTLNTAITLCHLESNLSFKAANAIAGYTARLYIGIQYLLRERPHVLAQRSRKVVSPSTPQHHRKSKKSQRKVRYVRTLYLEDEGLQSLIPRGHHASPSGTFGVRGHWRHYKNGKNVWIGPYTKGLGKTEYQTKEYELPDLTNPTSHNS